MNHAMRTVQRQIAAAPNIEKLVVLMNGFVTSLAGSKLDLPQPCRLMQVSDPVHLFRCWMAIDKLAEEATSKAVRDHLTACSDLFADAWERVVALGYKPVPPDRSRGDR
jgi:hypothetical protein